MKSLRFAAQSEHLLGLWSPTAGPRAGVAGMQGGSPLAPAGAAPGQVRTGQKPPPEAPGALLRAFRRLDLPPLPVLSHVLRSDVSMLVPHRQEGLPGPLSQDPRRAERRARLLVVYAANRFKGQGGTEALPAPRVLAPAAQLRLPAPAAPACLSALPRSPSALQLLQSQGLQIAGAVLQGGGQESSQTPASRSERGCRAAWAASGLEELETVPPPARQPSTTSPLPGCAGGPRSRCCGWENGGQGAEDCPSLIPLQRSGLPQLLEFCEDIGGGWEGCCRQGGKLVTVCPESLAPRKAPSPGKLGQRVSLAVLATGTGQSLPSFH